MIVVDASVVIAWAFNEEAFVDQLTNDLSAEILVAPPLWRLEVINILLRKERQKFLTQQQADALLKAIDGLGVSLLKYPSERTMVEQAEFARPHQLSAYDAAYVELAFKMQCPLMTFDSNQRDAAIRLGVELAEVGEA